jgi:hypothetical protein
MAAARCLLLEQILRPLVRWVLWYLVLLSSTAPARGLCTSQARVYCASLQ